MLNHYYTKEIKVVLQEESCHVGITNRFKEMARELSSVGIVTMLYSTREWNGSVLPDKDGLLWITDSALFMHKLYEQKLPRIAYFHEYNNTVDIEHADYGIEAPDDVEIGFFEKAYRRYRLIPWDILTTKRCIIRETIPDDVDAFYEIYQEPSIKKHLEALYPHKEAEKAYVRHYIETIYPFYGYGMWTVLTLEGDIIGRIGYSHRNGFEEPELGFVIAPAYQHQGIGEEVTRAVLSYGVRELGFSAIRAIVDPLNTRSLRLCCKLGFSAKDFIDLNSKRYMRMIYMPTPE
ncbi:MAG: GNAT family N-acetyltransferase [Clostridium sp.]|jgi:RimJ/RimL family protein N-acetyltransferase|nr:GNAT family N-acetyltransferase [Clostridium sp.]